MNKGKYTIEIIITDNDKEKIIKHEIHEDINTIDMDYDTEIVYGEAKVRRLKIYVER